MTKNLAKLESKNKNLLILSKRQYTGKDLLSDRFGRCWELPAELASLGWSITGITLSYRKRDQGWIVPRHTRDTGDLAWHSINLGPAIIPGLARYIRLAFAMIREQRPAAVLAMSDAPHIVMGHLLARRFGIKLFVDLYDNFESFGLTRVPGVHRAFQKGIKVADGVICVSKELEKFVKRSYGRKENIVVLGNAANRDWFIPMDQSECRAQLGLPTGKHLIGTAGALSRSRDIELLFRAADILAERNPEIELVVAGPRDRNLNWPKTIKMHDFGELPQQDVAKVFNALNVAIVCNRESAFGRYCFPQKIAEILACGVPVVAAETAVVSELLTSKSECLYRPGNVDALIDRIETQLRSPVYPGRELDDWKELARRLEGELIKWGIN